MRLFVKNDGHGLHHLAFWAHDGGAHALCWRVHSGPYVKATKLDEGSQVPTCLVCVREWWSACRK